MKEIDRMQGNTLKRTFELPVKTTYTWILMEAGIRPVKQTIKYAILMLNHNIKNSNEE